jgi:hypothetical protein
MLKIKRTLDFGRFHYTKPTKCGAVLLSQRCDFENMYKLQYF